MEKINWQKEYELNIPVIDEQHKGLVDLINQITEAKKNNQAYEIVRDVMFKLVDYTKVHFKYEEEHMSLNQYPKLVFHNAQHHSLINHIITLLTQMKNGRTDVLDEIHSMLSNWLIKHILREDKLYGSYYHHKMEHDND